MRLTPLALLPALALLTGAAVPASNDALIECRMPRLQAWAAVKAMPERSDAKVIDDGKHRTAALVVPDTLKVFGMPMFLLAKNVEVGSGEQPFGMMAAVKGPYDAAEKSALAGYGLTQCETRLTADQSNCVVFTKTDNGWRSMLLIQEFDDGNVGISCNYYRADD